MIDCGLDCGKMPKPIQRFFTASNQSKWYFGTGLTLGLGGMSLTNAAVAGTLAAVAGPVVLGIGGTLVLGTACYAGFRTFWAKDRGRFHDQRVRLDDLDYPFWSCHIIRVCFVGLRRAGKTEIKAKLRGKLGGERDTASIETHIFQIDRANQVFAAFIDGRGANANERRQQFDIGERAEVLVVILDHNDSDTGTNIDEKRIAEHRGFLEQLRKYLDQQKITVGKVFFILNKRDLWSRNEPGEIRELRNLYEENLREWRKLSLSFAEEVVELSAHNSDQIAELSEKIRECATDISSSKGTKNEVG
jgi:hypothetical protein